MSHKITDLKLGLDEELEEKLAWMFPNYATCRILRKSVDARKRSQIQFVYSVEVFEKGEIPSEENFELEQASPLEAPPLIIGSGPAGLFAALRFVERGIPCHIFERGSECGPRMKAIARHWRYGELNTNDNVCFGEGGAGLFSDGKLITRIKSPYIPYVMHRLVQFGAPEEIKYLANPHVGSDKIRRVIPKMRNYLISKGCTFHFNSPVTDLLFEGSQAVGLVTQKNHTFHSPHIILATGHSAGDIYELLKRKDVFQEAKSFAMGLRIEHPQKLINKLQYKDQSEHPKLGAANYKITYNNKEESVGVYSFCMCPGGYVLSSSTENNGVVCNGMSNYNRNSPFANSAIVVTVHKESFKTSPFSGLEYRTRLEQEAQNMVLRGGGLQEIPAQKVIDFLEARSSTAIKSSSLSGVVPARLDQLLPNSMTQYLREALENYQKKLPGFLCDEAVFHGIESRTSSPIRITRDPKTLQSLSHKGLYPTGEGAGYAGGITSAACDGIKVADTILNFC